MKNKDIKLPEFCNIINFEDVLSHFYSFSFNEDTITFNFSKLKWIGLLQLSLLYGWLSCLKKEGKTIKLSFPKRWGKIDPLKKDEEDIYWYLCKLNFFNELSNIGLELPFNFIDYEYGDLVKFKFFKNFQQFNSYKGFLENPEQYVPLLGGGLDLDIIRNGDFRDIILEELGSNAFLHADGEDVRYAIQLVRGNYYKSYSSFSNFECRPYIEIVFSDSGPGIVETLKSKLPDDYEPEQDEDHRINIPKLNKVVSYSLEFNSTCDEKERKKRLSEKLKTKEDVTDVIPTGLFYVSSLTRSYGGLLAIRTGQNMCIFDYSATPKPIITQKSNLKKIRGTHILIRVPRKRSIIGPVRYDKKPEIVKSEISKVKYLSLGKIKNESKDDAGFIVNTENKLINTFVDAEKLNINNVCLLYEGVHIDSKTFSMLLITLSVIPRRGRSLILLGMSSNSIKLAKRLWEIIGEERSKNIKLLKRIHAYKSYIILSKDLNFLIEFGDKTHHDSTKYIKDNSNSEPLAFSKADLYLMYETVLQRELERLLKSKSVKLSEQDIDRIYLLEAKYYIREFYQISKLFEGSIGRDLTNSYLSILIKKHNIGGILSVSDSLASFVSYLSKSIDEAEFEIASRERIRNAIINLENKRDKNKNLLIMVDVITTGRLVNKVLQSYRELDKVIIFCFVDRRIKDLDYFTVEKIDKAHSTKLISIFKDKYKPVYDLSDDELNKVVIVDSFSNVPTKYDVIEETRYPPEELIDLAARYRSLYHGHFVFNGKHYGDFLYFKRLFVAIKKEMFDWLDLILNDYSIKYKPNSISIRYLDEKKGWENVIIEYSSTRSLADCFPINRENLEAPPAETERKDVLWIILPAMASGNTTMKALAYATTFNPKKIIVSIFIARIDSQKLAFYQNITKYSNINVRIVMLSRFPLKAYPTSEACPLCESYRRAVDINTKTENYEHLSFLTQNYVSSCIPKLITNEAIENNLLKLPSTEDIQKSKLRINFEDSRRQFKKRRTIKNLIKGKKNQKYFIEVIGEDFHYEGFKETRILDKILYPKLKEKLNKTVIEILSNKKPIKFHRHLLFGIHRIFPHELENRYLKLFNYAMENDLQELCENMILLALLYPDQYGMIINRNIPYKINYIWKQKLVNEIRTYPFWLKSRYTYTQEKIQELLWLLKRSTPWGTNIEILKATIRINNELNDDISTQYELFEKEGVNRVETIIENLESFEENNPGSIWRNLSSTNTEIEKLKKQIEVIKNKGRKQLKNVDRRKAVENLYEIVDEYNQWGVKLVKLIEKIYINPIEVGKTVKNIFDTKNAQKYLKVEFKYSDDQPGILFGKEGLANCLINVIDNAINFITDSKLTNNKYKIEFEFAGFTYDQKASVMYIKDNIPWGGNLLPTGGMKQFTDYCKNYSAAYTFNPEDKKDGTKIEVVFKIKDKREINGR